MKKPGCQEEERRNGVSKLIKKGKGENGHRGGKIGLLEGLKLARKAAQDQQVRVI